MSKIKAKVLAVAVSAVCTVSYIEPASAIYVTTTAYPNTFGCGVYGDEWSVDVGVNEDMGFVTIELPNGKLIRINAGEYGLICGAGGLVFRYP